MRDAQRLRLLVVAVALGCSSGDDMKRFTPPEDDRIARDFLAAVQSHDSLTLEFRVATEFKQIPGWQDSITKAASIFPEGPIDTLRQVGVNVRRQSGLSQTGLSYEMHGRRGWGGVQIVIADQGNERKVVYFQGFPLATSLEVANDFSNGAHDPIHWVVLLLAIAMFLFTLCVGAIAFATPMKRRFLWGLFALVGGGQIALNWTTGALSFQPLQLVIFSSGIIQMGAAGPWIVLVAFPVGAVATLERLRREKSKTPIVASASDDTGQPG